MVSTRQGDEAGAGDAGGQLAPGFHWNHLVVPHVYVSVGDFTLESRSMMSKSLTASK